MLTTKSFIAEITAETFWESVNILLTKPHVVNKRLWGSKILFQLNGRHINSPWILPDACTSIKCVDKDIENYKSLILNELKISLEQTHNVDDAVEVILLELIPKKYTDKPAFQLACLLRSKTMVTFYSVTPANYESNLCPQFTYTIQLTHNELNLTAFNDLHSESYQWLINTLLPQFIKWGQNNVKPSILCNESLALISQSRYYEKYNELKLKYGKEMVKIWPECTDASKFVYEDVAIATYLLVLWEQYDSGEKKTFVDLGCGNGLLVYILTKEGHKGVGLDVRKRNIWDMYPPDVNLQEKTITPSDSSIFPDADWVIGNHSDELTPWIPVIAAKSSFKCNFFLLPCCSYNFDGSKYQRKNSCKSQYIDYLEYIKQLCEDCGFKVATDRLKIPSTKRICLVSNGRIYPETKNDDYCSIIDKIINSESNVENDFKAREPTERVKNCTQIDKNIIVMIVKCITDHLLEDCNVSDTSWSIGKSAEINQLVQLIPKEQLNILKSECGGLQTLLKNNHNIFKVQNGKVELRYPKTIEEVNNNSKKRKSNQAVIKIQEKPCWFYSNHPQGCPLNGKDCSFLHNK